MRDSLKAFITILSFGLFCMFVIFVDYESAVNYWTGVYRSIESEVFRKYISTEYKERTLSSMTKQVYRKYVNKEEEIQNRKMHLEKVCKSAKVKTYNFNFSQNAEIFYVNRRVNISFCKVPKAGSSFVTRLSLAFSDSRLTNDYILDIPRIKLHVMGNKMATRSPLRDGGKGTINVIMSRDPYTRLFSAYIDKIFLALLHDRNGMQNTTEKLNKCSDVISFKDFLRSVLKGARNGQSINRHWSPVYLLCHPCEIHYDIIVLQRTLSRDLEYVIDQSNTPVHRKKQYKQLSREHNMNKTVLSLINTYIPHNELANKCDRAYLHKIWKSLQIQGILRDDLILRNVEKFTHRDMFRSHVLDTVSQYPVDKKRRLLQRRRALINAYRDIPRDIIGQLKEMYALDFMLFDFDVNPPAL